MAWEIDPAHSEAFFSVRHAMVATARGQFNVIRGRLNIDEANRANSWVEAEVDAASVDTRNEYRDADLRSPNFFDVEKYSYYHLQEYEG
jgi:polyisoprenoid-binding protein YceI